MTTPNTMNRRTLLGALGSLSLPFGLALLGGCDSGAKAAGAADTAVTKGAGIPVPRREFPNHEILDHNGRKLRFHDDLIEGKVFAATFFYVKCKGICGDMSGNMKKAHEILGDFMGDKVQFYSFSLNEDTPEELRGYMARQGIVDKKGWTFFTGAKEVIKDIRWGFGFSNPSSEEDDDLSAHTGMVRFGHHPMDKWSSCPALGSPKGIARNVIWLFPPNERPRIPLLDFDGASGARPS